MGISFILRFEFDGRGAGWTDVTPDLHQPSGMDGGFGIFSDQPVDRTATTGVLTFNLINSASSDGSRPLGYYTIGHENQRTDFEVGIGVQVIIDVDDTQIVMWTGEISSINPTPGILLQRLTRIVAVDYMDKCARTPLTGLGDFTNYALFSNKFENAAWDKTRCTIDPNVTADPYLNPLADAIIASAGPADTHILSQTFSGRTADATHVWYVFAKAFIHDWVYLEAVGTGGGFSGYFDVSTGVIGTTGAIGTGTFIDAKIINAGLDWYVCIIIGKAGPAETAWTNKVIIAEADNDNVFVGAGLSPSLYLTRAQFEESTWGSAWIETEDLAVTNNKGLVVEQNIREEDAFYKTVDMLPVQPRALSVAAGSDIFRFCFDVSRDEKDKVNTEFQRLGLSAMGLIYTQADGTLTYESRSTRALPTTPVVDLTEEDLRNSAPVLVDDQTKDTINKVTTIIAPRREEVAVVLLYELNQPQAFEIGGPYQVKGLWTDPAQRASRAGGSDPVEAEAGVDYIFNTEADGSGSDVTDSMVVTTTFTGNATLFEITNNSGAVAYATTLQTRAVGLYAVEPVALYAENKELIALWGEQELTLEMPYQSSISVAQEVADWLLFILSTRRKHITEIPMFLDPGNPTRALELIQLSISDRISITETMTGLDNAHYFINAISFRMDPQGNVWLFWTPAPSITSNFWYLESEGFSELGITTWLGFAYITDL